MTEDIDQHIEQLNEQLVQLYQEGQYQQAIDTGTRALDLAHQNPEVTLGFAAIMNNLALVYEALGQYAPAQPLLSKTIEIYRAAQGESDLDLSTTLSNLGGVYMAMGKYDQAEPIYREAMQITRKLVGDQHPTFAANIRDLASLYQSMGSYVRAERLLEEAVKIYRAALGEQDLDFARSLNDLAGLYEVMEKYDKAEPLYKQALGIQNSALGTGHPEVATTLNNLAFLYESMGKYAAAKSMYQKALVIRRRGLGENHPDVATSLNNIAHLYRMQGNDMAAQPLLEQALTIRQTSLGSEHPYVAQSLNNLAALYVTLGRRADALIMLQQAGRIDNRTMGQIFSISSESHRMLYLVSLQGRLHAFLSLIHLDMANTSGMAQAGLNLVLQRKGIGVEALGVQRDSILSGRYPKLKPKLGQLIALRLQIAQKVLAGPSSEEAEVHHQLIAQLRAQREFLETEIAHHIPEMNLEIRLLTSDTLAIAQALPAHAALVEFIRFDVFDFKAVPARGESQWQPARYLAFVLLAGKPESVQMIDLGKAEPIERMIADFRAAITGGDRGLRPRKVPLTPPANDGANLRHALFDPLLPALAGSTRLFLAPDGDLTRLPFEALPTGAGHHLIDDYHLSYLSVGRDVLRFGAETADQSGRPLVAADPDFDLGLEGASASADDLELRRRQARALDLGALHFGPLPGTHVEGEHIAAQLGVQPWLKDAALEGRLRRAPSPRILHIATHGFFLEDQQPDPNQMPLGLATLGGHAESRWGRLSHAMANPLLRSGLALAGANTWLGGKPLPAEAEDGLLTAEDVSGLDLIGTELVVLSACDTGLGAVQVGEGVLGLRRAFVLAGAQTLVMSLWKVPDHQTQALMAEFYRRILAGENRADALRAAQLAMKARHPEPLYWGAFICQGEPGPLRYKGPQEQVLSQL